VSNTQQFVLLAALFAAGCGSGSRPSPEPSPQPPPQAGSPIANVTGRERVAWDQELLPESDVSAYEFAVYVNGERASLSPVVCESEAGGGAFVCSAALPPLRPGRNRLEFVAILDGTESERSEPLEVALATGGARTIVDQSAVAAGFRAETIATGLEAPTDLAMLPDGRLLIAERRGRVQVVAAGRPLEHSALVLEDIANWGGLGLFAIAAHPDFERNRFVYLAYAARQADGGAAYRVVRARELNNTLAEIAIVHESVQATAPAWMSLRFGPDGKLYVGVANCDGCGSAFAGAVLRLNDDGSTPQDNSAGSPAYLRGLTLPVSLSWRHDQLWIGDWHPQSTAVIVAASGREYGFGTTETGAIVTRTGDDPPVVLLTRPEGSGVHWYQMKNDGSSIERAVSLFNELTTVHAVLHAGDGAIYVCASDDSSGAARLIRVTGWQ
jgi:hypothetical protein